MKWLVVCAIAVIAVILHFNSPKLIPSFEQLAVLHPSNVMDLEGIKSPRLTGHALKLFAKLTRTPLIGPTLMNFIIQDNKLIKVREVAALTSVMPMYYPHDVPTDEVREKHEAFAKEFSIEDFAAENFPGKKTEGAFKHWTIQDFTDRYKSKQITPLQVIQAVLNAIEDSNNKEIPFLAFIKSNKKDILQQAKESTKRYAEGNPKGVIDGVPMAIKDEIDVAGYSTSHGTSFLDAKLGVFTTHSTVIDKLLKQGGIIVGKTNMHEVGLGTTGLNIHHGHARNPYDVKKFTGGSSAGSASAVAAGIVPIALGVDGGGSIRIPAGICGAVGLKASFMRIPFYFEDAPSVAYIGPITSNVKDSALIYSLLSGPDSDLPLSLSQPPVHLHDFNAIESLKDLTIGIYPDMLYETDPEIIAQFYKMVNLYKLLGATVVNVTISHLQALRLSHSVSIVGEESQSMDKYYDQIDSYSPEVQTTLQLGRTLSAMDFMAAQRVRAYGFNQMKSIFSKVDVFLTPTTGAVAGDIQDDALLSGETDLALTTKLMQYIYLGNLVGIPGLAVPMGYTKAGLPMSIQIQSDFWNEHILYRLGHVTENIIQNDANFVKQAKPQVYYSILDDAKTIKN